MYVILFSHGNTSGSTGVTCTMSIDEGPPPRSQPIHWDATKHYTQRNSIKSLDSWFIGIPSKDILMLQSISAVQSYFVLVKHTFPLIHELWIYLSSNHLIVVNCNTICIHFL